MPIAKSFHHVCFVFMWRTWHLILTICHFSSMFRERLDRAVLLCFPSKTLRCRTACLLLESLSSSVSCSGWGRTVSYCFKLTCQQREIWIWWFLRALMLACAFIYSRYLCCCKLQLDSAVVPVGTIYKSLHFQGKEGVPGIFSTTLLFWSNCLCL